MARGTLEFGVTAPPRPPVERCIPLQARADWDRALLGLPHVFGHTWGACRVAALTTGYATYLYSVMAGGARVACPLVERPIDGRLDVATPAGFSGLTGDGPCPGLPATWERFARRRGYVCGYLTINPLYGDATYAAGPAVTLANHTYAVDLRDGPDAALRRMSANRRRQLRAWRPGMHDADRDRLRRFFVDEYPRFMQRRSATARYRLSRASLAALCDLPNVFLLGATSAGRLESVSVFGHTPYAGDYLFNAALPGAERHSTLLLWSAAHRLAALGVPWLNLGGGLAPGDSLAEYKRRFGTVRRPMLALRAVYDPRAYDELCARAGAAGDGGFFPAYRGR